MIALTKSRHAVILGGLSQKDSADQRVADPLVLGVKTGDMGSLGMRLTDRTKLALRRLMFCAVNKGRTVRKAEIAEACNASRNHLAQVIHKLSQAEYGGRQRFMPFKCELRAERRVVRRAGGVLHSARHVELCRFGSH
jgi:hypothetical protein